MRSIFWRELVLVLSAALAIGGCTASKDITQAQQQLRQIEDVRQFNMSQVSKSLSEYRKTEEDEVLYHLEHGMLEHFRQEWGKSSRHFQNAQRAIEANYTKSINRNLQSMLVNDLQLPYGGEAYEDIYLNAIKSLNYLHQDDLEGAMVEARKVTHDLSMLSDRYKGLAESVQRDTAQVAVKKVDEKLEGIDLLGGGDDEAPIEIQQNSALSRFLTTVLYAKRGQSDDARIELRKLRTALEDQGDSEFLATLSDVAAEGGAVPQAGAASVQQNTTLRLRAIPQSEGDVPALQLRVDGRAVHTVAPSDMQQTDGRYVVDVAEVPAALHDSIAVVPDPPLKEPLHLEVWSDSLQYRKVLAKGTSQAAFVLGQPEIRSQRSDSRPAVSGTRTDSTGLGPARLTYAHTRATTSGIQQFEATRVLEPADRTLRPDWRIVERIEPAFEGTGEGTRRVDTMRLDRDFLHLQRYSHHLAQADPFVVRREDSAFVEAATRWHQQPVRIDHSGSAYGEGMGVEMALAPRSLSVGESLSLPVYVSGQRQVQTLKAHVTQTDSVTTPAGTHEVYVVRVQPPSAHQGTTTLYLRRASPHHVVKARTHLPVRRGERRDTVIVRRSLTRLDESGDAASAPPSPVASTDLPPPPEDPPRVSVSASSSPEETQSASATGRLVPTPEQLADPAAYNTLLVSFSGRAPKKKERSFTFQFVIKGEEYELNFAIPVLELSGTKVEEVRALAAGDTVQVPMIEEMQQVAQAMFDEKKSIIYTRAVIRSFLKAAATKGAAELAENQGGAGAGWLVKQAGQMASGYVAKADTRGWQTMPGFAYATVLNLPSGTHEVTFEYLSDQGTVLRRRTRTIEVAGTGDLALAESIFLE